MPHANIKLTLTVLYVPILDWAGFVCLPETKKKQRFNNNISTLQIKYGRYSKREVTQDAAELLIDTIKSFFLNILL